MAEIVSSLKERHQNIWMVGGAELTISLIELKLANELVITILPVLIGHGIPFFHQIKGKYHLTLKDVIAYNDDMVELTYLL